MEVTFLWLIAAINWVWIHYGTKGEKQGLTYIPDIIIPFPGLQLTILEGRGKKHNGKYWIY